jgi:hypothetical protein
MRRAALPLIVLVISIAAFAILQARGQRIQQALSPTYGDLATVQRVEIVDASGDTVLLGTFATSEEGPGEIERSAALRPVGGTSGRGTAEIEIAKNKDVVTKDEIELTAEGLPPSTICKLLVDGQQVSEFTTTNRGRVDLKLSRRMSSPK